MNEGINQSAAKALRVVECLTDGGFQGKTLRELSGELGIPRATVWRLLVTLKSAGWAVAIQCESGAKEERWQVSTKLAQIAYEYEQYTWSRINGIRAEYREVTGKELNV
ncbi:helix-turn-helix domain-containing protein [Aquisalimonas asiatica]|uniref:IclR helix-turn-helix domain-containing protein n=1 Tax=Aquisalimonas asiatica TaxID=406100 RepID=A0A1H8RSX8_9GAMM|nr:helix-turn-helix domain-containing protein [Aquisalimonas asiatica]SEO69436.1 IclR helix-turn-helix domain-containing protein [Aquisalimonas asiatica]